MMRFLLLTFLLLLSGRALSQQLVLIQGYLAQPSSWSDAGIDRQLEADGWHYAGEFDYASDGARFTPAQTSPVQQQAARQFFHVALPTELSLRNQAFYLSAYVKKLRSMNPDQKIILVGHSAGGVLARYLMVKNPELKIDMLITIASPHLGTDSAVLGKLIGESPLAMVAPFVGANTLNRSQGLYADLFPEKTNRFLYWLNRQAHPKAEYISVVRDQQASRGGDLLVPEASQYMENVYSLRYVARSYVVDGAHALTFNDAVILLDLIRQSGDPGISRSPHVNKTEI